jgi:hypothetical protein
VERITVGGNDILSLWPFLKQKMKMNATVWSWKQDPLWSLPHCQGKVQLNKALGCQLGLLRSNHRQRFSCCIIVYVGYISFIRRMHTIVTPIPPGNWGKFDGVCRPFCMKVFRCARLVCTVSLFLVHGTVTLLGVQNIYDTVSLIK